MNALNLPVEAVQKLMRHTSCTATQRQFNMARSMKDIVGLLVVPEAARVGGMKEDMRETTEDEVS